MDTQVLPLFALFFIAVATATAASVWLLTDPQIVARRLSGMTAASHRPAPSHEPLVGESLTPMARRIRSMVPKSPAEMGRIERLLANAGYHGPWPATAFAVTQLAITFACGAFIFWLIDGPLRLVAAVVAAAIGYYTPTLWLGRAIEARKKEIQNGLPDAIDLLIVCIEAGSGLDQALNKVADELALPYPALAHELELISAETRAGKPRLDAFRNFAERTKVDGVRSLVAMLVQTDRFGTSVGQALRTHAETSRTRRRQRAEERAAKLGVKLLFPLVFCLFPAFYLVVLGPSMLRLFRHLVWGGLQ
jgi:tight adherence protein C